MATTARPKPQWNHCNLGKVVLLTQQYSTIFSIPYLLQYRRVQKGKVVKTMKQPNPNQSKEDEEVKLHSSLFLSSLSHVLPRETWLKRTTSKSNLFLLQFDKAVKDAKRLIRKDCRERKRKRTMSDARRALSSKVAPRTRGSWVEGMASVMHRQ